MSGRDAGALVGGAGAAVLVAVLLFWLFLAGRGGDEPLNRSSAAPGAAVAPVSSPMVAVEPSEAVSMPAGAVNPGQRWAAQPGPERPAQTAPAGPGTAIFYDTPTPVSMFRPTAGLGLQPAQPVAAGNSVNASGIPASSGSQAGTSDEPAGRVTTLSPADVASAMDPAACGVGPAGDVQAWVVWRDRAVGVCFRQSVSVVGNVRLWGDGVALDLTEESRSVFAAGLGSRVVWFDRMKMPGEFYAEGWRRDRDAGDRVVFSDGSEIDYDLLNTPVPALSSYLADAWRSADYDLVLESVSRARDRLVIRVLGADDLFARMSVRLSDPLGREGCAAGVVRSAPVLADESGAKRATFSGYVSSCLPPDSGESSPYEIRAELSDVSGGLLHSRDFGSGEFDIELAARSVSYGEFGDALVRAINAARAGAGLHPMSRGGSMVAQRHAQDMVENCYASHWDRMGLKPYMRYSLDGGIHANAEVWVGTTSFCVSEGPERIVSAEDVLALAPAAVALWGQSPEHAAALFDPHLRAVSHGLAYDERNWRVVAVFETALAEDVGRALSHVDSGGRIIAEGAFTEEAYAAGYRLARAEIRYEPPFGPLDTGRLARTGFYPPGRLSLVVSDRAGSVSERVVEYADPHQMEAGLDVPSSEAEAAALFDRAKSPLGSYTGIHEFVPVEFRVDGRRFGFTVPSRVAAAHLCVGAQTCSRMSPGVYTITLVASAPDGDFVEFAGNVVWFGVDRPSR